jgi:anti-anti-sigma factor
MEISRTGSIRRPVLRITGMLDAYWSDVLSTELETVVRDGGEHVSLDLSGVNFISSAGLRVLLVYLRQLRAINGSFTVTNPSPQVRNVLDLSGLTDLVLAPAFTRGEEAENPDRTYTARGCTFDVYRLAEDARLDCLHVPPMDGSQAIPAGRHLRFPSTAFGFGVGAFGEQPEHCAVRYGEFLAAGGIAVCLPTDGKNKPDYLIEDRTFVPGVTLLHGVRMAGAFSTHLRFQVSADAGSNTLGDLAAECLFASGHVASGMVIVGETAGLVGAALRKSPVGGEGDFFDFPEVRSRLSYTPEHAWERSVAVVAGIAALQVPEWLSGYLRPMVTSGASGLYGHFHAAAFSFRPLPGGRLELPATLRPFFDEQELRDVLHLLRNDADPFGANESVFVRGACWIGPLDRSAESASGGRS